MYTLIKCISMFRVFHLVNGTIWCTKKTAHEDKNIIFDLLVCLHFTIDTTVLLANKKTAGNEQSWWRELAYASAYASKRERKWWAREIKVWKTKKAIPFDIIMYAPLSTWKPEEAQLISSTAGSVFHCSFLSFLLQRVCGFCNWLVDSARAFRHSQSRVFKVRIRCVDDFV